MPVSLILRFLVLEIVIKFSKPNDFVQVSKCIYEIYDA